jgi:hypothetical protein
MKYNEKADKYLADFYRQKKAKTAEQKFHAIRKKLKYAERNMSFHSFPGGDVTWEQKQGTMEYELLEFLGLITVVYV